VSGKLYAWGSNEFGQLGLSLRYMYVCDISTHIYIHIYTYTYVQVSGKLYAWGSNEFGQLGLSLRYMDRHCTGPDAIGVCCNGMCRSPQRVQGACAGMYVCKCVAHVL
jgi:hypothetical protein